MPGKIDDFIESGVTKFFRVKNYWEPVTVRYCNRGIFEKAADFTLTPAHYLFGGRTVSYIQKSNRFAAKQTFNYNKKGFMLKMAAAILLLAPSLIIGIPGKKIVSLSRSIKNRNQQIKADLKKIRLPAEVYKKYGLDNGPSIELKSKNVPKPGLSDKQKIQVAILKKISDALNKHGIKFWIECGTALGAYRHGGMIPWDTDIDFGIIVQDHFNVLNALREELDLSEIEVLDESSYGHPNTYIRLHHKATDSYIDFYHYAIDEEKQKGAYIFGFENNPFLPEANKQKELRYTKPLDLKTLFPLNQATFEGHKVPVPNDLEKFLKTKYGENLDPCKVWDAAKKDYVPVKGHIWQD